MFALHNQLYGFFDVVNLFSSPLHVHHCSDVEHSTQYTYDDITAERLMHYLTFYAGFIDGGMLFSNAIERNLLTILTRHFVSELQLYIQRPM